MADPEYEVLVDSVKEETRQKFVETLFEHELLDFKSLYTDFLEISETNARHHLKLLMKNGIIQKEKQKGTKAIYLRITPKFLERVRTLRKIQPKYAYLGMIGIQDLGLQAKQVIHRLISNRWEIEVLLFFTTEQVIKMLKKDTDWLQLKKEFPDTTLVQVPLYDFDETFQIMKDHIENQVLRFSVLADVTGATKIHTLALYSLAKEYGLKRIYIPKEGNHVITLP